MSVPTTEPVCYIVGAGECGGLNFSKTTGDLVIAADGGLTYLEREGIAPDLVLGDFDSLEGDRPSGNVLAYPSEKDETDMFLAVRYA
ncbi:MAG: thiamine diphosphokinase, partial [Clostridiales bacterium]